MKSRTFNQVGSQSGFSLVSVMVAISLITLGMSALADMMRLNQKVTKNSEVNQDINQLFLTIQSALSYSDSCQGSLAGQAVNGEIVVYNSYDLTKTIAAANYPKNLAWSVASVKMTEIGEVPGQAGVFSARVDVTFTKNTKFVMGAPRLVKTIDQVYYTKNGSSISACLGTAIGLASAQGNCTMLGGKWMNGKPFGSMCEMINGTTSTSGTSSTSSTSGTTPTTNGNGNGKS